MKKLTSRSWKIAKKEFDKGNNLWLAKPKKHCKYKEAIEIIKSIKDYQEEREIMLYSQWDKDNGYSGIYPSKWEDWNFKDYDFFILNKKEARPYLKEIMVDILIGKDLK